MSWLAIWFSDVGDRMISKDFKDTYLGVLMGVLVTLAKM